MMRTPIVVVIASLLCGAALGQSTPKGPVFEIADVHASPKSINIGRPALAVFRNGRYENLRATMLDFISAAYSMDTGNIVGGPTWLDSERFDIVAKAPADTKPEALKLMLQTLLADRFQLTTHRDTRPEPGYALTVGKGKLQLKPSGGAASGCLLVPPPKPNIRQMVCHNITMERLATTLTPFLGPVIDSTGLTGTWDLDIQFTPPNVRATAGDGNTIFESIDKLGLKLERHDTTATVLVVDRANEQPAPNPPGTQQALVPPKDPKFEVASIKPSAPGSSPRESYWLGTASGRMTFQGTLRGLITIGWNVDNDNIVGLPKFAETDHFDINADPPESVTRPLDNETVRRMLQALLADRFALAVHLGEQPMDVYVLGAPKSEVKMKRGNDAERGSCKPTPELLRADSGLSLALTCINTTMPQLADKLRGMAPSYVNHPAVNETGLDGAWDFDLMWTGLGLLNGRVNIGQPGDRTDAQAQLGGLTFFEAIEKQLGLKLTLQKRPMPVLVIDHLDSKPTEN